MAQVTNFTNPIAGNHSPFNFRFFDYYWRNINIIFCEIKKKIPAGIDEKWYKTGCPTAEGSCIEKTVPVNELDIVLRTYRRKKNTDWNKEIWK